MPDDSAANLTLWDRVKYTDPDRTRHINQRGGFTSIDSYYTIKRATEVFGPLGEGWGFDARYSFRADVVICRCSIWYKTQAGRSESFTVCTMNQLVTTDKAGKRHVDEDAAKKALTDAITKGLSYLGFSADVFEGLFDDNRYVAALREAKAQQEQKAAAPKAEAKPKPAPARKAAEEPAPAAGAPKSPLPDDWKTADEGQWATWADAFVKAIQKTTGMPKLTAMRTPERMEKLAFLETRHPKLAAMVHDQFADTRDAIREATNPPPDLTRAG